MTMQLVSALRVRLVGPDRMIGGLVSMTLKVRLQVLELEAASVALKVTTWSPRLRAVPGAGSWLRVTTLHASVALSSPVRSGRIKRQSALALSERLVAQRTNTG